MYILRSILVVLTALFAIGAIMRTLRQRGSSRTADAVLVSSLLGQVSLLGFACAAFFRYSWTLLALGYAVYGMVAALGFQVAMLFVSPSSRRQALLGLLKSLPWWSGVLVSLLRAEWLPLLIGIGFSVLLYLVLPSDRSRTAETVVPVRTEKR